MNQFKQSVLMNQFNFLTDLNVRSEAKNVVWIISMNQFKLSVLMNLWVGNQIKSVTFFSWSPQTRMIRFRDISQFYITYWLSTFVSSLRETHTFLIHPPSALQSVFLDSWCTIRYKEGNGERERQVTSLFVFL